MVQAVADRVTVGWRRSNPASPGRPIWVLGQLDTLSQQEYEAPFLDVMDDPVKVRRLTGVMVKAPFASAAEPSPNSKTGARRTWVWGDGLLHSPDRRLPEFQLLDELREWRGLGPSPGGFAVLTDQLDTEGGIFKVTALWLQDRLRGRDTRSLREYYGAAESNRFKTLFNLADYLANFALTPVYAAILPAGGFVVPIVLIAAKYGYRELFDSDDEPDKAT